MLERHDPGEQFVHNLEWLIGGEIRRHNRAAAAVSPLWRMVQVAAVVIVSMGLGAAAMGASYQIEDSWRRDLRLADLEVRLELARARLELVAEEAAGVERRAAVGTAGVEERGQMNMQLADAEARVRLLELELEEVRASGREPLGEVSSPAVRGRDFVSERLEVELELAAQMLELVRGEVERQSTLQEVGAMTALQLDAVRIALIEHEHRLASLQQRLAIRGDFLDGRVAAVEAELMVRIVDTEALVDVARRRFDLMQRELETVQERVRSGTERSIAAGQYELALAEAEASLRLGEVELDVLRRELRRQQ
jgi:hypothetical protein